MPRTYTIKYLSFAYPGDNVQFNFIITGASLDHENWVIEISGTLRHLFESNFRIEEDELPKIAAKALELYVLGSVPSNAYTKEKRSIDLSYWYPGTPSEGDANASIRPEMREEFEEFEVVLPKPRLGFDLPSKT